MLPEHSETVLSTLPSLPYPHIFHRRFSIQVSVLLIMTHCYWVLLRPQHAKAKNTASPTGHLPGSKQALLFLKPQKGCGAQWLKLYTKLQGVAYSSSPWVLGLGNPTGLHTPPSNAKGLAVLPARRGSSAQPSRTK